MNEIIIIISLILLNGIFAMSEIALISARKSSLNTDAKKGSKAAKLALKLANEPDRFLSTIQIGITLIGIGDTNCDPEELYLFRCSFVGRLLGYPEELGSIPSLRIPHCPGVDCCSRHLPDPDIRRTCP